MRGRIVDFSLSIDTVTDEFASSFSEAGIFIGQDDLGFGQFGMAGLRIVITGVAGFVGSRVARYLLENFEIEQLLGIDNFDPFYDPAIKEENTQPLYEHRAFRFYGLSIGHHNARLLFRRFYPHDLAIHLAERPGIKSSYLDPKEYIRQNAHQTRVFLELCRAARIPRIILGSTGTVYQSKSEPLNESDPINVASPYGHSKKKSEDWVRMYSLNYGFHSVILRMFHVYGPGQRPDMALARFAQQLMYNEKITLYGGGEQTRDFTYIDDICEGFGKVVSYLTSREIDGTQAGQTATVNLATGYGHSLHQLIQTLEDVSGKKADIDFLPSVPGDMAHSVGNPDLFEKIFGYRPTTTLEDGVKAYWEWLSARRSASAPS